MLSSPQAPPYWGDDRNSESTREGQTLPLATFLPASPFLLVLSLTARQPQGPSHWSIIRLFSYERRHARQTDAMRDSSKNLRPAEEANQEMYNRKCIKYNQVERKLNR